MKKHPLDALFQPESVAVIGASERAGSIGRALVENLVKGGFEGGIYPLNPKYQEIQGLAAHPDIGSLGTSPDLAVIAIPIKDIPGVMRQCGAAGVGAAIIISTGGRETGPEGERLEADILAAARETGIRYLGPGSWGVLSPAAKLAATFAPMTGLAGNLAFVSQSGALCSSVLGWATRKNIGFSHFISVGSKTDLDFADLIDYLGDQAAARSIVLYMESLTLPRKFMSAARAVSRIKPVIVVKAGRGLVGGELAASHALTLAEEDAAYSAAFRRAGIIRVDTIGQLFDCAEALGKMPRPVSGALGIITNGAGPGIMAVDALGRWEQEPAILSPETLARLDEFLPPFWERANPVDLQGDADPERFAKAVRLALAAKELAGLIVILSPQALTDPVGTARAVAQEVKGTARPVFAVWMGGEEVAEGVRLLNAAGIPTFETPEAAVDTFMEMFAYSRHLKLLQETPPRLPREIQVNTRQARAYLEQFLNRGERVLSELVSKAILSAYGIPVNPTVAAATDQAAVRTARELGYPVVLKVNSPELALKTAATWVRSRLRTDSEVTAAFQEIMAGVKENHPGALILGVTVQTEEAERGLELLVGSHQDPRFGPLIRFGLGGSLAEALEDWALDLPPLNLLLAGSLMHKTRVHRVLSAAQQDVLAELLVRVSQLVTDFPEIVELSINPLQCVGGRFLAVDARLVVEKSDVPAPRHLIIAPYPNQYETDWMLRDGTPVLLRPMKPEDEPLVERLLKNCSDDTLYFRYFRLIKNWTHEMLIRFTQNDYDREIGLAAIGQPPGPEVMMGVGRLVMDADRQTAEFAVIVADPWQGKGLGPRLLQGVIDIAREQGVRLLGGDVLATNQPMLDLVTRLGFKTKRGSDPQVVRVEMAL